MFFKKVKTGPISRIGDTPKKQKEKIKKYFGKDSSVTKKEIKRINRNISIIRKRHHHHHRSRSSSSNSNNLISNSNSTIKEQEKKLKNVLGDSSITKKEIKRIENNKKILNHKKLVKRADELGLVMRAGKRLEDMSWSEKANYYSAKEKNNKINPIRYTKSVLYRIGSNLDPRNIYETVKEAPLGVLKFVKSNDKSEQISQFGARLGKSFKERDPKLVGDILTPFAPNAVIKTTAKISKEAKFIGRKETKSTKFIDKKNLEGKDDFPKVDSTNKLNKLLKKSKNTVVTASPTKLNKKGVVGHSRKSAKGLEDSGIYVAPKGKGNKYFLRISDDISSKYSLNPKKLLDSLKSEFQVPTITEFKVKGSVIPPKKVLKEKGFKAVNEWQEKHLANTGKISTTKRGHLGRGEIKRQGELGTTEIEFVIPKGTKFKTKNTKHYVKIDGHKVLVQKGIIDSSKKLKSKTKTKLKKLSKESKSNSKKIKEYSSEYKNVKYKSPYKYLTLKSSISTSKSSGSTKGNSKIKSSIIKKMPGSSNPYKPGKSKKYLPGKSYPLKKGNSGTSGGSSKGGSSSGGGSSGGSPIKSFPKPIITSSSKITKLPKLKSKLKNQKIAGYNIYVNKRNKFQQLNVQPLKFKTALSNTKRLLDNTLLSRAKISGPKLPSKLKLKKFTAKRTKKSIIITEKPKYRLDTKNEKNQIKRNKRLKK